MGLSSSASGLPWVRYWVHQSSKRSELAFAYVQDNGTETAPRLQVSFHLVNMLALTLITALIV